MNIFPFNDRRDDLSFEANLNSFVNKSVDCGFKKTLITIGDKRYDPWVVAQYALQINKNFGPVVATNPAHQHPVALLKKLASLQNLYSVPISLNLISGSFINELSSIGDSLSFEERTERLTEFISICEKLLAADTSYSYSGKYYHLKNVDLFPKTPFKNTQFFISGSFSDSATSFSSNHFYIKNARPLELMKTASAPNCGLGIGICARATYQDALEAMNTLYPADRKGELLFQLALNNNETPWNIWLKTYLAAKPSDNPLYNLNPLTHYQSKAPFVVGSYETVTQQLKKYMNLGYSFFLLDFHLSDFEHVKKCLGYFN